MSEWREVNLDEIVKFRRGHDLTVANILEGSYPVAGSNGVIGYHNQFTTMAPGITLGRSGNSIGVAHYYDKNFWAHNTTLYTTEFISSWPKYIFYFLRTIDFSALNSGSAVPSLNRNHIHSIRVKIPDLREQKAIAAVLSSFDNKIDLLHRQNKTLEAMAETLFRQWFVEEAGEDWENGKLGDEFDFTMGQSPSGSSFNQEGIGTPMFQGNADFEFRFPTERVYTTEPTRFAQRFDTLISVRAPVGAQNMAHKACCIGRGVAAFRYKNNNNYYTYTYFKLRSLMEEIKKFNDEGTVFGSISKSDFDTLEAIIPPFELIMEFEKETKPINDKVIENCTQIRTLETLRDTLLSKLMSGEVRVTV